MNQKCDKYESLFLFGDDQTLQNHIEECEDCRKEHEKMQKVSALVKEVAPQYKKRETFFTSLKVACVLFLFLSGGIFFQMFNPLELQSSNTTIATDVAATEDSIIASMGLPTDDYGLLMLD